MIFIFNPVEVMFSYDYIKKFREKGCGQPDLNRGLAMMSGPKPAAFYLLTVGNGTPGSDRLHLSNRQRIARPGVPIADLKHAL
jgi:hypothetical protein